jgi:hypothetical protein
MKTIKKGDKGDEVKLLQEYLQKLGNSLKIDGDFGATTDKFVREFQTKLKLTIDGVVGDKTWAAIENEIAKQNPQKIAQVSFESDIPEYKQKLVTAKNLEILATTGGISKNPNIIITSTVRTPLEQAIIMYDNEKSGNHINYAAPGKKVIEIFNANKGKTKEVVVDLMVAEIEKLAAKGELTSRHCVPEAMYLNKNIIDVSKTRTPNPRDFVNALLQYKEVSKIITPIGFLSTYKNDARVFIDLCEPAIHIEF